MRISKPVWLLLALIAGACGGSSNSDAPQDPALLIQDVCETVVGLNCSSITLQQCIESGDEARAEAAAKGCGAAFDAVMQCYAQKLTDCSQDPQDLCATQFEAAEACDNPAGGDECSLGSGGAGPGAPPYFRQCDIFCPAWGAHCESDSPTTLACSCTQGPKAGATFGAASCQELTVNLGAQHCKG